MRSAFALRIFSGKNYFKFRVSGKSADFPEAHFHGRGGNEPSQSPAVTAPPKGEPRAPPEVSSFLLTL